MRDRLYRIKSDIFRISEMVYFFMFVLLTVYSILTMVCLEIVWENIGETVPVVHFLIMKFMIEPEQVLLILVIIRYVFGDQYKWKELLAAAVVYMCASHAVEINGYSEILTVVLLMLGARGISFKKIIKVYFTAAAVVTVCVFAASQTGLIENLVYRQSGRNLRMAFGFTYPTRFAAHVYYLILWYWYLKNKKMTLKETLLPVGAGIFLWVFCEARLSSIFLLILSVVMVFYVYQEKKALKKQEEYRMNVYLAQFLAVSAILFAVLIFLLSVFYDPDRQILEGLNRLFSNRLYLGKKAIDIFGFLPWGRWIRLAGNGGYLTGNSRYFYIDSAFLQFGIQYGLVMLTLFLLLFYQIGIRAKRDGQWVLLWVMMFAGIHGMFEPHLINISYSPLLFAAFADIRKEDDLYIGSKRKRKNEV